MYRLFYIVPIFTVTSRIYAFLTETFIIDN